MAAPSSEKFSSKFFARFQEAVDDEDFYEASQISRSLFSRLLTQKRFDEATDFLVRASEVFVKNGESMEAADLAMWFLEALEMKKLEANEKNYSMIARIVEILPSDSQEAAGALGSIITRLLCLAASSKDRQATVFFHRVFANKFMNEGKFEDAAHHATRGAMGKECGKCCAELYKTYGGREDVVLVPVLELLCMKADKVADEALCTYQHEIQLNDSTLLELLIGIIKSCTENDSDSFLRLSKHLASQTANAGGNEIESFVNRIGWVFFQIKPSKAEPSDRFKNMLTDLQSGKLDGGDSVAANEEGQTAEVKGSGELDLD